jgi:DNA-binding transcriptional LysR family regulator
MVLVHAERPPERIDAEWIRAMPWVLREPGSGTRSTFEAALSTLGIAVDELDIVLVLPSNEAVRTAAEAGAGAAVLSRLVVSASLSSNSLYAAPLAIASRSFHGLRHKERYQSNAAQAFLNVVTRSAGL